MFSFWPNFPHVMKTQKKEKISKICFFFSSLRFRDVFERQKFCIFSNSIFLLPLKFRKVAFFCRQSSSHQNFEKSVKYLRSGPRVFYSRHESITGCSGVSENLLFIRYFACYFFLFRVKLKNGGDKWWKVWNGWMKRNCNLHIFRPESNFKSIF